MKAEQQASRQSRLAKIIIEVIETIISEGTFHYKKWKGRGRRVGCTLTSSHTNGEWEPIVPQTRRWLFVGGESI